MTIVPKIKKTADRIIIYQLIRGEICVANLIPHPPANEVSQGNYSLSKIHSLLLQYEILRNWLHLYFSVFAFTVLRQFFGPMFFFIQLSGFGL